MPKIAEEHYGDMRALYESGITLEGVGRHFGCSRYQVKGIMLSLGVEIRQTAFKRIPDPTLEEIKERAAEIRGKWIPQVEETTKTCLL